MVTFVNCSTIFFKHALSYYIQKNLENIKGKLYPQMLNSGLLDSQYLHVDVLYAFNSYCE